MGHAAPPTASPADPSARFLAELENLWTLLRVYGTEHPAFQRCASAAAGALTRQLRVSVSPEGLTVGKSVLNDATLRAFAHRLKSMGLVGLVVDPGMTPAAITALVQSLNEADRSHLSGAAVVEKLAAASQRRVTAIPLRLAGLKLTEGVVDEPAEGNPNTTVWRNLFSAACYGSDGSDPGELAASFEEALTSVGSPAQWEAMV